MYIRRLFAIGALILIGGILVACGAEDEDPEPTTAPTTDVASDEDAQTEATEAATEETEEAPMEASPAATPVEPAATALAATAVVEESGTPQATPAMDSVVPAVSEAEEATPQAASPEAIIDPMTEVSGTLTLDGSTQQDFTLSGEGCVGLGEWRQLSPGSQVIVRNAYGTVVDIGELEAVESEDTCNWTFSVEVPEADYFSISIPMVTEVWFDQNDPAIESGELELMVP